ncbi:MAG TPA: hypothetical protein VN397_02360 [Candidatus Methylomirabilis sp.]|nr:hypothetical protein [Candidatus Methylomirabilis sp.]
MKWRRHPQRLYVHWSAVVLTAMTAAILVITVSAPVRGSAHNLSRSLAVAGQINIAALEKIPDVPPVDPKLKGKTLIQQCQEKVPKQYWGICCKPPDYTTSDACQDAMKKEHPPEKGDTEKPLSPAEIKLLPVAWQKEYAQLKKQAEQFQKQVEAVKAEIARIANCELGCPGGAGAFQCTEAEMDLCISHNACIRACDKDVPQLQKKIEKLAKTEADLVKKALAFKKKVDAYKVKNKRKFRAIEGASR